MTSEMMIIGIICVGDDVMKGISKHPQLELKQGSDHATLCRAYGTISEAQQRSLNAWFLEQATVQTGVVAMDATGFSPTHASRYYISRTGRAMTSYCKGFYVIDVERRYILGWRKARSPGGSDAQYLNGLRRQAAAYATRDGRSRPFVVLADKGFDGLQAKPTAFIRPRRGQHPIRRLDRVLPGLTDMAYWEGFMGCRRSVETTMSVTKRKTGGTIRSHSRRRQRREIGMNALVYNLHL